ncbi:transcription elongation factor GreA [Pseudochrobactrum sp. HB0163]|uniref:transcription elongation factor GreA n=1 Tax=Pseudochrobactrum sp. HB0163 TaxID=3450708 RepID=UPI003F6E2512
MSRAFTKELDDVPALLAERPVSPHRNLVTRNGLAMIEAEVARLQQALAQATAAGDKSAIAQFSRDLRYWTARRETAELTEADSDSDVVRFGMQVVVENEDGRRQSWDIVGEDEADPSQGSISHIAPLAVALFGKGKGELVMVNGREFEIISFKPVV